MADNDLLSKVTVALRRSDMPADLKQAGVSNLDTRDPLIRRAVITYCRANFWPTGDYDKLKASYDEQKAQLRMTTNYTDWLDA